MRGLASDLRHAIRLCKARFLSTASTVLTMALTFAGVTACFALWDDVALTSHRGFATGRSLITIGQTDGSRFIPLSFALIEEIDEKSASLSAIAGVMSATQYLDDGEERRPIQTEIVTSRFFPDLRPALRLGRSFEPDDHRAGAEPVVIVSYDFWQSALGGSPDALGRPLQVRGPNFVLAGASGTTNAADTVQEYRVVGVMADGMRGTFGDTSLWMPYEQAVAAMLGAAGDGYKRIAHLRGLGLPANGATPGIVRDELNELFTESGSELGLRPDHRIDTIDAVVADIGVHRNARRQVLLFLAGTVLIMLVGVFNISLFLLSGAFRRQKELAIRSSLGASFARLARQLATEGALLVAVSAVIGFALSFWLAALLTKLPFFAGAEWHSPSPIAWRVLLMVAGLILLVAVLVSVIPLLGFRRFTIAERSRMIATLTGWRQRAACTVQIAIAGSLIGVALAFLWQMIWLENADPGVKIDVHALSVTLPDGAGIGTPAEEILGRRERWRTALLGIPGVESVSFGSAVPGKVTEMRSGIRRWDDADGEPVDTLVISADPSYGEALGFGPLHGRQLDPNEPEAVLVNEELARRLWGRSDVVGELVAWSPINQRSEIRGVVPDIGYYHPAADPQPAVYRLTTALSSLDWILVSGSLTTSDLRRAIQARIDAGELTFRLDDIETVRSLRDNLLSADRARTWVAAVSSALVVLMAALGLYGTLAQLFDAGKAEYAVRAALGASPRSLGSLALWRSLSLGLPGLALACLLSLVVVAKVSDAFAMSSVSSVAVALLVAAVCCMLVLGAGGLPIVRAWRLQPSPLLRET